VLASSFDERLLEAISVALFVLLVLFAWGWWERWPSARFLKFSRGFLEPTMALAVPTFICEVGRFHF
jgi:hypothetical protein